ncbi:hypothetical protein EAX61_13260 [Dokdonia sinensis]|uniref:DUF3784 domain-containing protein n=1 Tax=Dokdonia sinensis TaxID=2479847 RepID=A0A3M0FVQ1_9FLAO|nr:hypothetical protein [Dokdonia sinensis]RMB56764.1 hypothetical protein EAX61_13260 [Dokdonia sinensis]
MKKEITIGFITGLCANALGVLIYILMFSEKGIDATIKQAIAEGFLGKIVTLGAVLNLVAFFIYIKKKEDYRARGVLLATVLIAIATMILIFI